MGKLGSTLAAGGKGMLDGMAEMGGLPGNGLLGGGPLAGAGGGAVNPMSGLGQAGGPMSGIGLMNMLFEQIFHKKKSEDDMPQYQPTGIVGPR